MTNTATPSDLSGLVLLWNTAAHPDRAARLHAAACPMVNTGRRGGKSTTKIVTEDLEATVADLNEREYPVKRCKCCK